MRFLPLFALLPSLLPVHGCGPEAPSGGIPGTSGPEAVFGALEERLLSARAVELQFHITAEGAVDAELRGRLTVTSEDTRLEAEGLFAGERVDLLLRTGGEDYEFGSRANPREGPAPEQLNEALFIGLTRMGLLHNLAMLAGNAPPDGAQGGVQEWVVVRSFQDGKLEGGDPGSRVVSFSMVVGGVPAGTVSLEIGPEGNPRVRNQTVQFPEGEMRVVERYSSMVIDP